MSEIEITYVVELALPNTNAGNIHVIHIFYIMVYGRITPKLNIPKREKNNVQWSLRYPDAKIWTLHFPVEFYRERIFYVNLSRLSGIPHSRSGRSNLPYNTELFL